MTSFVLSKIYDPPPPPWRGGHRGTRNEREPERKEGLGIIQLRQTAEETTSRTDFGPRDPGATPPATAPRRIVDTTLESAENTPPQTIPVVMVGAPDQSTRRCVDTNSCRKSWYSCPKSRLELRFRTTHTTYVDQRGGISRRCGGRVLAQSLLSTQGDARFNSKNPNIVEPTLMKDIICRRNSEGTGT